MQYSQLNKSSLMSRCFNGKHSVQEHFHILQKSCDGSIKEFPRKTFLTECNFIKETYNND